MSRRNVRRWTGWALAALLAGGCGERGESGGAGEGAAEPEPAAVDARLVANLPPGTDRETAETGRRLFTPCAVCHGPDGAGTQLGPSLRDTTWIGIAGAPEEIERVIREGVAEPEEYSIPMPVMGAGAFSDAEVRALAAYVYAMSRTPLAPARR